MASRRLEVVIAGNASDAVRALGQTERAVGRFDSSSGRSASRFSSLWRSGIARVGAAIGGLVVGGQLASFFSSAMGEAEEARAVMRQTAAVIESTGGVAGVTADHLSELAGQLSDIAAVDDEVIQQGGNVLLTFRNVKAEGGIFDDALASALDMSAALGTDLQGNVMAVGKALNDPIAGISKLTRMGVTFTDQQKEQIATMVYFGDTAGAQRIILEELADEFGGAAEANATSTDKIKTAWDNLKEAVGTSLLPAFDKASEAIAGFLNDFPDTMGNIRKDLKPLEQSVHATADGFKGWMTSLDWKGLTQSLSDLGDEIQDVKDKLGITATNGEIAMFVLAMAVAMVAGAIGSVISVTVEATKFLAKLGGTTLDKLTSSIAWVVGFLQAVWGQAQEAIKWLRKLGGMVVHVLGLDGIVNSLSSAWSYAQKLLGTLQSLTAKVFSVHINVPLLGSIGFASGTESAPPGLHWVGERGPELMAFRGGERVFPHGQSMRMAGAGTATAGTTIIVHVNGTGTPQDGQAVVDALRTYERRNGPVPVRFAS